MATSRSIDQFAKRMTIRAKALEEGVEKLVQKVAIVVDQVVVNTTPVDTGRAKNNWTLSVGAPITAEREPDKTGAGALADARLAIGSYRLELGSIFITNGVPYIIPLENGHSAQRPFGFAKQAVQAGSDVAARLTKNLLGR